MSYFFRCFFNTFAIIAKLEEENCNISVLGKFLLYASAVVIVIKGDETERDFYAVQLKHSVQRLNELKTNKGHQNAVMLKRIWLWFRLWKGEFTAKLNH